MSDKFVVSAECIIRDRDHNILTIIRPQDKHAGGLISFPGGGCEAVDGTGANDCLKNIAIREVFEEVGLKLVDDLKYLFSSMITNQHTGQKVIHVVFLCDLNQTPLVLDLDRKEVPKCFWWSKEQILSHHLCPAWIKHYLELI